MAMMVGITIASMIAIESMRMVFSAAPIGPCGSRMFIGAPNSEFLLTARISQENDRWIDSFVGLIGPSNPFGETAPHHVFKVAALEPCQFLGEKRDTLTIAARHPRNIRAPEHALRTERIENSMQSFLNVAERVALRRIMRRAGGLDRNVGQLCQR